MKSAISIVPPPGGSATVATAFVSPTGADHGFEAALQVVQAAAAEPLPGASSHASEDTASPTPPPIQAAAGLLPDRARAFASFNGPFASSIDAGPARPSRRNSSVVTNVHDKARFTGKTTSASDIAEAPSVMNGGTTIPADLTPPPAGLSPSPNQQGLVQTPQGDASTAPWPARQVSRPAAVKLEATAQPGPGIADPAPAGTGPTSNAKVDDAAMSDQAGAAVQPAAEQIPTGPRLPQTSGIAESGANQALLPPAAIDLRDPGLDAFGSTVVAAGSTDRSNPAGAQPEASFRHADAPYDGAKAAQAGAMTGDAERGRIAPRPSAARPPYQPISLDAGEPIKPLSRFAAQPPIPPRDPMTPLDPAAAATPSPPASQTSAPERDPATPQQPVATATSPSRAAIQALPLAANPAPAAVPENASGSDAAALQGAEAIAATASAPGVGFVDRTDRPSRDTPRMSGSQARPAVVSVMTADSRVETSAEAGMQPMAAAKVTGSPAQAAATGRKATPLSVVDATSTSSGAPPPEQGAVSGPTAIAGQSTLSPRVRPDAGSAVVTEPASAITVGRKPGPSVVSDDAGAHAPSPALLTEPSAAISVTTPSPGAENHVSSPAAASAAATHYPTSPAEQIAPALLSITHQDGVQRMTLRLHPAELGMVQVRIEQAATGPATVDITVDRSETLQALQRDQPQLHRALDQAGVPAQGRTIAFHVSPAMPQAFAAPPVGHAMAGGGHSPTSAADSHLSGSGSGGSGARDQAGNTSNRRQNNMPSQATGPDETIAAPATTWRQAALDITA